MTLFGLPSKEAVHSILTPKKGLAVNRLSNECTPDALACLLAVSVHEQGCRTAMHDSNGRVSIFAPAPL
jgi:hypothetical protein